MGKRRRIRKRKRKSRLFRRTKASRKIRANRKIKRIYNYDYELYCCIRNISKLLSMSIKYIRCLL